MFDPVEVLMKNYRFDNQNHTPPLDCSASHGSTASLVEAVTRKGNKRGPSRYPEDTKTVAKVHPDLDRRGVRASTGAILRDTPKRRRQYRKLCGDRHDKINIVKENTRPSNQEEAVEPFSNDAKKF